MEAREKAEDHAQWAIDLLPNNVVSAREEIQQYVRIGSGLIKSFCFEKAYRLTNTNEINLAFARLLSAIERSRITFDAAIRRAEIDEIRGRAAGLYKVELPPKPALKVVR